MFLKVQVANILSIYVVPEKKQFRLNLQFNFQIGENLHLHMNFLVYAMALLTSREDTAELHLAI